MSFTQYPSARARLQRSLLAVPGSCPQWFETALNSDADYVLFDCADAVAPGDKLTARANVITALNEFDWRGHGKSVSVRINGPPPARSDVARSWPAARRCTTPRRRCTPAPS